MPARRRLRKLSAPTMTEEGCSGEALVEGGEGVDSVVGGSVGTGGVDGGGGETWVCT